MVIHVIASRNDFDKTIESLRGIISTIHAEGHTLAMDWIEAAFAEQAKDNPKPIDWTAVYQENINAVNKADVLIAETSYNRFGIGYQIAIAQMLKKPILMLHKEDTDPDTIIQGMTNDWVRQEAYNEENVESLVKSFLRENDIPIKDMRFNFFIDRHIYNHLRWAAHKTGKTKAEVLRELVLKEIDKEKQGM